MQYTYHGDRHTDPLLKLQQFNAVRRADGKCIRGKNGSMLVETIDGKKYVVMGRLLRKLAVTDAEKRVAGKCSQRIVG